MHRAVATGVFVNQQNIDTITYTRLTDLCKNIEYKAEYGGNLSKELSSNWR